MSASLRVGFDVSKVLAVDGIGAYSRGLLSALLDLETSGPRIELVLYALDEPVSHASVIEHFHERRVELESLPFHPGNPKPEHGLDLFHSHTWLWPEPWRGALLLTCYDLTFLSHPECHTLSNKVRCLGAVLRTLIAGGSFLAISRATAESLHESFEVGEQTVHVSHPAVDPRFRPKVREGEPETEPEAEYLLSVGTLEPRKNLPLLVEALAGLDPELRRRFPLWIVGGGGWRNEDLRERIAETLPEARFLGRVTPEELVALYRGATLMLYPSLAEGFGLPVLEAMACGTPVLTSSVSSLPEVAGGAARLVDPLDVTAIRRAVRELLESPEERGELGRLGLRRAGDFSWPSTAARVAEIYAEIAARRPAETLPA